MLSQPLATIKDYDGLHAALRARATALQISRETLEELAGLGGCYVSKLLAARPAKTFGKVSLGALLSAMGVKLVLVEDAEALARVHSRLLSSRKPHASSTVLAIRRRKKPWNKGNSDWGQYAAAHAMLHMSESARRKRARVAARARWAAVKAKKLALAKLGVSC